MKQLTFILFLSIISSPLFSQKEIVVLKRGHVMAQFAEGQYFKCVLKKNHRHTEGHILELSDFSMITSSDTIKFQDIDKIDIRGHRGSVGLNRGVGGLLFMGGLGYLAIDQLNAAIGIHSGSLSTSEIATPLVISGIGALMVFIRTRYIRVNRDSFIHVIDYKSPYYH